MEIKKGGILDIDLIIAFLLVLFTFIVSIKTISTIGASIHSQFDTSNEIAFKIAKSYGVLSQLSEDRDNEITLTKLQTLKLENVSLRTMSGYYYGGNQNSLCIKRGVYIKDIKEVGILEVC